MASNSKIEELLRIVEGSSEKIEQLDDVSDFLYKSLIKTGRTKVYMIMLLTLSKIKRPELIKGLKDKGYIINYDFFGAYTRINKRAANHIRERYYTTIGSRRYEKKRPEKKKH